MGSGEAMAVIGIGTTSRARVEDVLAVIEAAHAKIGRMEAIRLAPQVTTPHPVLLPMGEGTPEYRSARATPFPLPEGEGQGEGLHRHQPWILAALDRPALNGAVEEAARRAGLKLILLTLDELRAAAHFCATHSEKSMKQYGIPSVAEAAALAAAGACARLLIPRFCGRNTTASVAIVS
jgi:Cobalamin synthesis G C-terminus